MKVVTTIIAIYVVLLPARHFVRQVRCSTSFNPHSNSWVLYSTDEETEAQINYFLKVTQLDRKVGADIGSQAGSFQSVAPTTPPWLTSLYLWGWQQRTGFEPSHLPCCLVRDSWTQSSLLCTTLSYLDTPPFSKFMFSTYIKYISSNLHVYI